MVMVVRQQDLASNNRPSIQLLQLQGTTKVTAAAHSGIHRVRSPSPPSRRWMLREALSLASPAHSIWPRIPGMLRSPPMPAQRGHRHPRRGQGRCQARAGHINRIACPGRPLSPLIARSSIYTALLCSPSLPSPMSKNPYSGKAPPAIVEPTDAPPAYTDSPTTSSAPDTGKSSSFSGGNDKRSSTGGLAVPGSSMSNNSALSLLDEERELPAGWIRQWDPTAKHHFYVDTKAKPPRSIWVHPYDDPQYIASIPDKAPAKKFAPPPGPPPPTGSGSGSSAAPAQAQKGFFGNIKNKLNGTPEERERRRLEAQQREAEMRRRYEQRQQEIRSQGYPGQYGPQGGYAQPQQQGYYAPQPGYYAPQPAYAPQPYYQPQYAPPQQQYQQRSSGFGGGGMALPLLGGLAGGFLLGDMIGDAGDGGGDGGDW
ncbi:hypothetical protein CALCODRAFT_121274 [Calocera cornea HHB12733]|uniref:Uncharacterized protein n=1 Tax=Calocera cornea HHB12733 TaxID=1353952 RepID=A0A165CZP2_9BASI|nr:hypothetical protein CALCODRAFT_121274 [Calocera cornea HHB12733]